MRFIYRLIGNVLLTLSAVGALGLGWLIISPESESALPRGLTTAAPPARAIGASLTRSRPTTSQAASLGPEALLRGPTTLQASAAAGAPIGHLSIAAVGLSSDVVPASLVERDGGVTWQVPAFVVGHAEMTPGAGQTGNALLLGHVESVHSGNVFATLDRVAVGDVVEIAAGSQQFDYVVVATTRVPRDDASVFYPRDVPSVSLVTCAGVWLPTIWDFTERLVVRAELVAAH